MKTLVIIKGTPGAGKTTTCKALMEVHGQMIDGHLFRKVL